MRILHYANAHRLIKAGMLAVWQERLAAARLAAARPADDAERFDNGFKCGSDWAFTKALEALAEEPSTQAVRDRILRFKESPFRDERDDRETGDERYYRQPGASDRY